ncbi:Gfo/Idh/MocA family oxidoreductase [Humibacter soli]
MKNDDVAAISGQAFDPGHPAGVGIVGCGNISRRYVEGMRRFPQLRLVGCADLVPELAARLAEESGITAYPTIGALLADPAIDVVVNITPPVAHAAVTIQALDAGKHVYVEKPIAATLADSEAMLGAAERTGLLLGAAPDTFLGSAAQTARAAIDAGAIGAPIGAVAFVTHSKAEQWHPNPTFLFQPGGGPSLDLGPYYVTALVNMLGPVATVAGFNRIGAPFRTVTAPNRHVDTIEVTTPTHAGAILRLESGVIVTMMLSFDAWDTHLPFIEVYGDKGTLTLPDPNGFDGDVTVRTHDSSDHEAAADWLIIPPVLPPSGASDDLGVQLLRGFGVADLVDAIGGEPHRASGALARHVLEVLEAIQTSTATETVVRITSTVDRPEPRKSDSPAGTGEA